MTRLINRNVRVGMRRTSIRLEPEFWAVWDEIHEVMPRADLLAWLARVEPPLTSAVRVAILRYAATGRVPG